MYVKHGMCLDRKAADFYVKEITSLSVIRQGLSE